MARQTRLEKAQAALAARKAENAKQIPFTNAIIAAQEKFNADPSRQNAYDWDMAVDAARVNMGMAPISKWVK